ncbi:MAG: bifunctional 4-hydroxy-2-oxoglutarate aldolase/2-dehydro-3-deoxy-phosphogluconate aldolase [Clostridia bacterium]|nr:bifunctional 4-hydroxy-2-oxoglutarate aldolase/2-dehydro-3-deoxy-phosphogluconate aldolase [Clostridia bacterium]
MREEIIRKIEERKVIAIVRGIYDEPCVNLARALCAGGVELLEVTFDQQSAAERERTVATIRKLIAELGDRMAFGAGTVTTVQMVIQAKEAGAQFIVSPNTDEAVIRATVAAGMVSIPGALTPTEIKFAHDCGGDFIKVFPACNMGVSYFKNIHAPLSQVRLLAVGGVGEKDANDYLDAGASGLGVAGCLFKKDWVNAGEWQRITEATRAFTHAIHLD